jgi:YodL-like
VSNDHDHAGTKYRLWHNFDSHYMRGYQDGDRLIAGYQGHVQVPPMTGLDEAFAHEQNRSDEVRTCEEIFRRHNRDDRPDGRDAPSLSVGDVVTLWTGHGWDLWSCQVVGWHHVPTHTHEPAYYVGSSFTDMFNQLRAREERGGAGAPG